MSAHKFVLIGGALSAYLFRAQIGSAFGMTPAATATPTKPNTAIQPPGIDPTKEHAASGSNGNNPVPPIVMQPPPLIVTSPLVPLPITDATLIKASWDPDTARLLGNNPAGMLNTDQWSYYRNLSGRQQITADLFPANNRGSLVTAIAYQQLVADAQAAGTVSSLSGLRRF